MRIDNPLSIERQHVRRWSAVWDLTDLDHREGPGRVRARSQITRRGRDNAGAVNFELEARGVVLLGLLPYHMPPQPQKQGDAGLIPRWYYFTLE